MSATEHDFLKRYANLNEAQKKAVDTLDGPVLVLAGPGSGKTEILSLRVANILRSTDTSPSSILCLTFTEAAATNMRSRLAGLIGPAAYRVGIYTFHGFCSMILDSYPDIFFGGAHSAPADDAARHDILDSLFNELSFDNPLSSKHPEQGYVYTGPVRDAISHLKRGGITPQEFTAVLNHNEHVFGMVEPVLTAALGDRITKATPAKVEEALDAIRNANITDSFPLPHLRDYRSSLEDMLALALEAYRTTDTNESIKKLKEKLLKSDDDGAKRLADALRMPKMRALAALYTKYQERLHEAGLYDFDDMIIDVVTAIEKVPSLQADIRERFQYFLVDEFQDTNDGQMRLIAAMVNAPEYEGRPNIMVVGDDDQAIYRFQGATLANIFDFQRTYREPTIITMTNNYRSAQPILDIARAVVVRGDERLELLLPELSKELTAHGSHAKRSLEESLRVEQYPTFMQECVGIAQQVNALLKEGVDADSIAIIARRHQDLLAIASVFSTYAIPVRYDRRRNVLEEEHVDMLITMLRYIATQDDSLLHTILSFPFWNVSREDVWRISVAVPRGGTWLGALLDSDKVELQTIGAFFADLVVRSESEPAERILDSLIGAHIDTTQDEEEVPSTSLLEAQGGFVSPFREYFFSAAAKVAKPQTYLTFLSSLRVFVQAVREHAHGKKILVRDVVAFVQLHETAGISLLDTSPFAHSVHAVSLLTAHGAKGLEFDTVFVISCTDVAWVGKGRPQLLPLPINLPLAPLGDTTNDKLRLLYVALTRARASLRITYHTTDESGKSVALVPFLVPAGDGILDTIKHHTIDSHEGLPEALSHTWKAEAAMQFADTEQAFLQQVLERYRMSVTHLNTFLDVTLPQGGPQTFFENNLIRFPQAKSASGVYGTAMHEALASVYSVLRREGNMPQFEEVLAQFDAALCAGRLPDHEYARARAKGEKTLQTYFDLHSDRFDATHIIEQNFAHQDVCVEGVVLTGAIDKMVRKGDVIEVYDYKTGRAYDSWEQTSSRDEVKLYKYARQLTFYKILVENSREFGSSTVYKGVLEFVEHGPREQLELMLTISDAEVERTKKLIKAVYAKICALDFPDTSEYEQSVEGIRQFEDDLISRTL